MSRSNLKNILLKSSGTSALLSSLIRETKANVYIEDEAKKVLSGNPAEIILHEIPIKLNEEIIGWVKGDDKVFVIAEFIDLLIQKEVERKKLGNEVLLLYQEVNMIFNFSEKLAQTIGQNSIAAITLEEAMRLIKSDNGLIILWDEKVKFSIKQV